MYTIPRNKRNNTSENIQNPFSSLETAARNKSTQFPNHIVKVYSGTQATPTSDFTMLVDLTQPLTGNLSYGLSQVISNTS